MAQAEAARTPVGAANASLLLTDREAYEIQQYEKIVQLRDAILLGTHRFIKPPHNVESALAQPFSGSANSAVHLGVSDIHHGGLQLSSTKAMNLGLGSLDTADGDSAPALPANLQAIGAGRVEINPILLEKSVELVRAELALQRQRLERSLRDEVEQRRVSKMPQAERYSDLDLSNVLDKALAIVPAVAAAAAPTPADENLTANNEASNDSFDDNTFYSSQHGTPHSHMTSRIRNESEEGLGSNALHQQPTPAQPPADEIRDQRPQDATDPRIAGSARLNEGRHDLSTNRTGPLPLASIVPGLKNYIEAGNATNQPGQITTSGEPSQSDDSGNMEYEPSAAGVVLSSAQQPMSSYIDNHPPSPLIRGHALQPVAPRPAQISPLAVSGRGQDAVNPVAQRTRGTPAQVAALRNETSAVTSPDSSSQGGRASDKKKSKRKKRKADRQAPEVETATYIKPEPRSPSPLTAPSYIRANKRQRHSQGQVIELEYEPQYQRPLALGPDAQYLTRQFRDEVAPLGYESSGAYPGRAASTTVINDQRFSRDYIYDPRIAGDSRFALPGALPLSYSPTMAYPARPVSQAFASDGFREPPRSYREYPEGGRMSGRLDGDTFTGPPKPGPPTRLVDAFGREYFDPSHPAVQRPNAPPMGVGEAGLVYERLPPRAVSRHPGGPEPYGEGGVTYGGASVPYAMPRRIVTQPEYASFDYRDGTHRDYSERPTVQPGSFIEARGPQDRRYVDQAPRGYATRAASMLPVEAVRYEVPQGYGRVQSVRPDAPGRDYAASVHPEMRREALQPYAREYAAQPMGQYHQPQARAADEIAFIERPRGATQEIVYADDARREVYR